MPPRKAKAKIILESDSEDEIVQQVQPVQPLQPASPAQIVTNFENYKFEPENETIYDRTDFYVQSDNIKVNTDKYNLDEIKRIKIKYNKIIEDIHEKNLEFSSEISTIENKQLQLSLREHDILDYIKQLDIKQKKLEDEDKVKEQRAKNIAQPFQPVVQVIPNNKNFTTIKDLANALTNEHQQAILWRINTDAEGAKVYLQNFEPNTDKKKKTLKGTINILGNYNKSKGIREAYNVKVFKDDPKGSFWCSCADHKFNSGKKNIVCKHICFIVCKVLKITQTYFFEPVVKKLSNEHLEQLLARFADNSDMWKDKQYVRKSDYITINDFKIFPDPISDTCTFCYDEMTNADKDVACACPICKHCFHEECMGVWLESQNKCSFCSNNFWTYYKRIKAGETKISLAANKL